MRNITQKEKPPSAKCVQEMMKLDKEGVGSFLAEGADKAFFKLPPTQASKEKIEEYVNYELYMNNFKDDLSKDIGEAQARRLQAKNPYKD